MDTISTEQLERDLAQLVALSGQSDLEIRQEALREYLAWRLPQVLELQASAAEANRGEFASDAEVRDVFKRYGV